MNLSQSKSLFAILIVLIFSFGNAYANQITVSSDPNRVAQYTNLQTAFDAAANGDTLLVYGSVSTYGNLSMYKPMVLVGEGYNSTLGLVTTIGTITVSNFNSTLGASNSTIMGFNISSVSFVPYFSGSSPATQVLDNITFLRNQISSIEFGNGSTVDTYSNISFINCHLYSSMSFDSYNYADSEDVTFSNCIFGGFIIYGSILRTSGVLTQYQDLSNVKIYNSLFLNYETGLLNGVVGLVLEDNIFVGHELYNGDYAQITWNNNLFYLIDQLPLGANDNVGSGNLLNTNPLFTNYPATPADASYSHDYSLQAGSPALTASATSGEIGIFGGAYPYDFGATPPVPKITEITIQDGTSSVPVGGTINFNFKAQSGN